MFVEPVHLHPFYALIDCGQQKQETRQCGSQYGACEWDTSDQRSRMMTRSVRVLCSWLTVGTSWIYSKCKYYFLRRNCDLPLPQLRAAYILYTVPKQPCSSQDHSIELLFLLSESNTNRFQCCSNRPEWTSSHQCTSSQFSWVDGLLLVFIWSQMGFIIIHLWGSS
jgi:hypothetical protein